MENTQNVNYYKLVSMLYKLPEDYIKQVDEKVQHDDYMLARELDLTLDKQLSEKEEYALER